MTPRTRASVFSTEFPRSLCVSGTPCISRQFRLPYCSRASISNTKLSILSWRFWQVCLSSTLCSFITLVQRYALLLRYYQKREICILLVWSLRFVFKAFSNSGCLVMVSATFMIVSLSLDSFSTISEDTASAISLRRSLSFNDNIHNLLFQLPRSHWCSRDKTLFSTFIY
jgi:hypothetical protein